MTPRAHDLALTWLLVAIMWAVAFLDLTDRAVYQGRPPDLWTATADSPAWTVLYILSGAWLAGALATWNHHPTRRARHLVTIGCGLSMVALIGWGGVLLAWGLTIHPPVSLMGATLLLLASPLSVLCAGRWAVREV